MGLLSFFKRGVAATSAPAAKPVADTADAVQLLRLRARHRLIGAAVLVALGVIGFPLVFETQPRPIPVDLPIDIPRKEAAGAALVIPAPLSSYPPLALLEPGEEVVKPAAASSAALSARAAAVEVPAPVTVPITAPAAEPLPVPTKAVAAAEKPPEKLAVKVAERPVERVVERPLEKPPEIRVEKQSSPEADRVQALLEGKPTDKKAADTVARFILQVGAYADSKAAQDVRMRVEKIGLKTYIQAVETADGRRIRVRVGPFTSRDEADKAAGKLRGSGLSTVVLTL